MIDFITFLNYIHGYAHICISLLNTYDTSLSWFTSITLVGTHRLHWIEAIKMAIMATLNITPLPPPTPQSLPTGTQLNQGGTQTVYWRWVDINFHANVSVVWGHVGAWAGTPDTIQRTRIVLLWLRVCFIYNKI